ncbi:MAG: histidine kinase [Bacteroidetes bacterium]|nr:histidine kinase [Bacteroidota bacterium]
MKKLAFLTIILIISLKVNSQEFATRLYTPQQDGLLHIQVRCVKQASDGRIWVGTQGGLSCFDGLEFKNYTEQDGLSANLIYDIQPWKDSIFVVTRDGIDIIVDGKIINYFSDEKIKFVRGKFKIDEEYQYLIAYDYNQSFLFDIRKKEMHLFPDSLQTKGNLIADITENSIIIGKGNTLYELPFGSEEFKTVFEFKTNIGRIEIFNDHIFVLCYHPDYPNEERGIMHQLVNNEGIINEIPFKINNGLTFTGDEFIDHYWVFSKYGNNFLSTNEGHLVYFDNKKPTIYSKKYNFINGATEDQNGNVWIATEKGLLKIFTKKFQYYTPEQGFTENVWTAAGINDSLMLFGSYNNRIHVYKNQKDLKINDSGAFYHSSYSGACYGFHNDLLVCTFPGIARYDFTTNKIYIINDKMPEPSLTLYKDDLNKRVLVGNLRTLVSLNDDYSTERLFDLTSIGNFYTIISIAVKDNKILLGLTKGLLEFDPITKSAHYIINDNIRFNSILVDDAGAIWAATSKGLMHITKDTSYFIQGIENPNELYGIISVKNKLFTTSQTTLYTVDLKEYDQTKSNYLKSYDLSDGFQGNGPHQNAFFTDYENNIWLPASTAVVKIFPSQFENNSQLLNTEIVDFGISDGKTDFISLNINEDLAISYSQNNVKLTFVAVNQINPEKTEYSFTLENSKRKWHAVQKERYASFINLPHGNYIFTVKASSENSFEKSQESVLFFTIRAPFWYQWWFLIFVFFSFTGMVIGVIKFVKLKEQKKKYIKTELLQLKNIALSLQIDHHFIANCTSKIVILNESGNFNEANNYTRTFSNFLKSNLKHLRADEITLEDELTIIKHYVELEQLYGKRFKFDLNLDKNIEPTQINIPPFLIQPLVENAIKHGAKKCDEGIGEVSIEIQSINKQLFINISDNGPGMDSKNEFTDGNRLSLDIIKDRLRLIGKSAGINFNSSEKGTKFIITLPL